MSIVEMPVPLIYLDENRAFGGALDDATYRLKHYREVFQAALSKAGLEVAGGCC
jgi:dolichol-phosphate mannosyltransferase